MEYTKQYHKYQSLNLGTSDNITTQVQAYCPFPVKKIKFNFAYVISSADVPLYIITCDATNNDVVGVMNKYAFTDGANHLWFIENFKQTNVFEYIFRDPIQLANGINFTFDNQLILNQTISNNVVVHIECLGE